MSFRPLKAEEIEVRIDTCNEKGVSLLLYKDARVDRAILDETLGAMHWQCRFYERKGNLFCSVGIRQDSDNNPLSDRWIWKDDCGAPSNMEAEKGEASDAFKRACFKWGIGIELYTAPFIWVNAQNCNIKQGRNGKPQCYDRFFVEKIETEKGKIKSISIKNQNTGKRVFLYVDGVQKPCS